jgi:hypothetical protein
MASVPIAQAFPIVRRAIKVLADREVSPQTGLLKSTLLQLDSTFSERTYGASSFLDFAEKLAQSGLVQLKHAGRSVMVELMPGFSDEGDAGSKARPIEGDGGEAALTDVPVFRPLVEVAQISTSPDSAQQQARPVMQEAPVRIGDNAEGVRVAGQLMTNAVNARWPMYLRNVKQILRAAGYDERKYGFGGLMDLLKACQREGLVRVERDRRGGLRVFQGSAMARTATTAPAPISEPAAEPEMVDGETQAEAIEAEAIEPETVTVVDTTAELLGRAKPRRPRTRATTGAFAETASHSSLRGARPSSGAKAGTRKSAATRPRAKKKDAG